jgi:hypothetical protein
MANIIMGSDGGCKDNKGSIGIVVQCDKKIVLKLSSRTPEIYDKVNSHQSECNELLISVQLIHMIQQNI